MSYIRSGELPVENDSPLLKRIEAKFFQLNDLETLIQKLKKSQAPTSYEYRTVTYGMLEEFLLEKWEVVSERTNEVNHCRRFHVPAEIQKVGT
jgi:hypothetical protein